MVEHTDNEIISLSKGELELMLEKAATAGARIALHEVGLDDGMAVEDLRDLRNLIKSWRVAKSTAFKTIVQLIVNVVFLSIIAGFAVKFAVTAAK